MPPRYWLSRLVVALEVLIGVVLVGWLDTGGVTAQALSRAGGSGWALMALICATCVIALADVLINDISECHIHAMQGFKNVRHIGFMLIAVLLGSLAVLVAVETGYTPLLIFYWLNAALAACVTFLDAFARVRAC